MGRFSSTRKASNFRLRFITRGHWRMSWTVDYYYADSTLRWPRRFKRDTDDAGAARFARKHNLEMPTVLEKPA
jgi:hypothetical protein